MLLRVTEDIKHKTNKKMGYEGIISYRVYWLLFCIPIAVIERNGKWIKIKESNTPSTP